MGAPIAIRDHIPAKELAQHAVLGVADAEARLDDPTQILGPPSAHAVAFRIRAAQDQGLQRGQLAVVEPVDRQTLRDWVIRFNAAGGRAAQRSAQERRPTLLHGSCRARPEGRPTTLFAPVSASRSTAAMPWCG
jgi:hypothetical protein